MTFDVLGSRSLFRDAAHFDLYPSVCTLAIPILHFAIPWDRLAEKGWGMAELGLAPVSVWIDRLVEIWKNTDILLPALKGSLFMLNTF